MIKVIIADAQFLIRLALRTVIENNKFNIEIIGEANSFEALMLLASQNRPDVVLLDYTQKEGFSIENIKTLKKSFSKTNILIISSDNNKYNIYKAIDFGGIGYLTKDCDQDEILNAIAAVAKGEKFMCHKIIDIVLDKDKGASPSNCLPINISFRELEIIELTANGKSAKEIAKDLFLSTHTVYTHKKNIMKKIGVNTTSELILYAIQNDLVRTS
jgi:DNA-binding NarL/FixJ family response regulator